MRYAEKSFPVRYKVFDVGERVSPTSSRCPLEPGIYTVTRYIEPRAADDKPMVFLAGRWASFDATHLGPAQPEV